MHAFILTIPAVPPSASLRVAYLLNLTSFIAPALDGYTILDETIEPLFDLLARFDRGWVAVLRGDDWDSSSGQARSAASDPTTASGSSLSPKAFAGGLRTTDRARLDSLIKQIRSVLAISLGLPQFVPLETDPFLEMLRQRQRPDLIPPIPGIKRTRGEGGGINESDSADSADSAATTDDEAMSQSDAMLVDSATDGVTTPSAGNGSESMSGLETDDGGAVEGSLAGVEDDDEDVDDAEFEEVPVTAATPSSSSTRAGFGPERLPNAMVDPPDPDGSFEIHYEVPPPTLHDGEVTLENGATPIVGQRKGFDPDEEYPLSEEEGDPIVPPQRESDGEIIRDGDEEEDGIDDSVRDRLKHVFELTLRALEEIRVAEGGQE